MTMFTSLCAEARGFVLLGALLALIFLLWNSVRAVQLGKNPGFLAGNVAVFCVLAFGVQPLFTYHYFQDKPAYDLPLWLMLAVLLLSFGFCVAEHLILRKQAHERITNMSVKESFDNLPAGLCCWFPGGLLKLVNAKMDALSCEFCGGSVQNGETFWNALQSGAFPGCLASGEQPIYRTADGAVYAFRCYPLALKGQPAFELVASDVTEEVRLTEALEEKQRQVQIINQRLRSLNSAMEYLNMNRELLALKAQLHDQLGQSLLYAKRCLSAPDTVDRGELRELWRFQVKRLKNELAEDWQAPYFVSTAQAPLLGIELKITGELPREEALLPVVDTAITVHLTNVLRHATGKTAFVAITETSDSYTLVFSNDGAPPAEPVHESGGLGNLRRGTELLGGTMEIVCDPMFRMTLRLPKQPKTTDDRKTIQSLEIR